jgi:multicomponent Na+:H+ antiporter subunit A
MQIVVGTIMVVAALAATASRRRFAAVLLLSAVGYGMAALFIVQGAPDLALTQLLVETLGTVAFVLVLRHLPEGFTPTLGPGRRALPAAVGVVVGAFVFFFALTAGSVTGTPTPDASVATTDGHESAEQGATETPDDLTVSEEYLVRSLPEAHGKNIVNVIVVDFRGFDTLGEITVLLVAGVGVVALIRSGRKRRGDDPDADPEGGDGPDAADGTERGDGGATEAEEVRA